MLEKMDINNNSEGIHSIKNILTPGNRDLTSGMNKIVLQRPNTELLFSG